MGVREEALAFIHSLQAASEAQDIEAAEGFVVVTLDPETATIHLNGRFEDPVDALAWAEQHEASLNSGNGPEDLPFACIVRPLMGVS